MALHVVVKQFVQVGRDVLSVTSYTAPNLKLPKNHSGKYYTTQWFLLRIVSKLVLNQPPIYFSVCTIIVSSSLQFVPALLVYHIKTLYLTEQAQVLLFPKQQAL